MDILTRVRCLVCVASGSFPSYIRHALELTGQSSLFGDHLFGIEMACHPNLPGGGPALRLWRFRSGPAWLQLQDDPHLAYYGSRMEDRLGPVV